MVPGDGDLATALGASMSIPAPFPPVEIGGRLLVDGGVVNGLPVDVARAMGADVVIGSQIPGVEVTRDDLRSLTAALAQTMSIMIAAHSRVQTATFAPADVHLVPEVGAVGMLAFEAPPTTVSAGRAGVGANADRIAALGEGRAPPAAAGLGAATTPDAETAHDRLEIDDDGPLDLSVIRARLDLPAGGAVSVGQTETAVRDVYGLGTVDAPAYPPPSRRAAFGSVAPVPYAVFVPQVFMPRSR